MRVTADKKIPFRRVMVTGGCGFIGSAVVRRLIAEGVAVLNVDRLTYSGSPTTVEAVAASPLYEFARMDICDGAGVAALLTRFRPEALLHLAAETHVDRSIDGPAAFVETNLVGTFTLLQAALVYQGGLSPDDAARFRFLHISTDEVYGSLDFDDAPFTEASQYQPNSPYSASKAGADHLVRAWGRTYGLPVLISNCSNNYGPFQFPEKMIPTMILAGLAGRAMPVYGAGENRRDWLYVEDHVSALLAILAKGRIMETYLVGGGAELRNIDLVHRLCDLLDALRPNSPHRPHHSCIRFCCRQAGSRSALRDRERQITSRNRLGTDRKLRQRIEADGAMVSRQRGVVPQIGGEQRCGCAPWPSWRAPRQRGAGMSGART